MISDFCTWLQENADPTNSLDFEGEIEAPGALSFRVFQGENVIVAGKALAVTSGRGKVKFWVQAPQIGLADLTPAESINSPVGNFIKDYVVRMWSFPDARFLKGWER